MLQATMDEALCNIALEVDNAIMTKTKFIVENTICEGFFVTLPDQNILEIIKNKLLKGGPNGAK
jgi:hypothetical protein